MSSLHINIVAKINKRSRISVKNYRPAIKVGSLKCSLYVVEGNSAMTTAERGIDSKQTDLECDYMGVFSLQGVPMNVRKEVNVLNELLTPSSKLIENERLTSFLQITNLDFRKKYEYYTPEECKNSKRKREKTEQGNKEFKTL